MDFNVLMALLGLCLLLWWSYKFFLKPEKKYKDYIWKSIIYEVLFLNKKKAIDVLKKGLEFKKLNNVEKASINLEIGLLYFKRKEYKQATFYFEQAFDLLSGKNFLYESIS